MNLELLRQVCVTPGAPGFEDKIRDFIIQEVAPLVDAVRVDNLGSVIAIVEGKDTEKTMMAAAHMDEIGFMVRHIDDKGFIKFLPLGGFDAKTLTAQRVIVHGKKDLIGVMGVKPIHVMSPAAHQAAGSDRFLHRPGHEQGGSGKIRLRGRLRHP